mgnify:CR=1 FL=1
MVIPFSYAADIGRFEEKEIDNKWVVSRIEKSTVVERSSISNIMNLSEPSRSGSTVTATPEFTVFENQELDVKFSAPVGWMLQQPPKSTPDTPDVVAVGPQMDGFNPNISLTCLLYTSDAADE